MCSACELVNKPFPTATRSSPRVNDPRFLLVCFFPQLLESINVDSSRDRHTLAARCLACTHVLGFLSRTSQMSERRKGPPPRAELRPRTQLVQRYESKPSEGSLPQQPRNFQVAAVLLLPPLQHPSLLHGT